MHCNGNEQRRFRHYLESYAADRYGSPSVGRYLKDEIFDHVARELNELMPLCGLARRHHLSGDTVRTYAYGGTENRTPSGDEITGMQLLAGGGLEAHHLSVAWQQAGIINEDGSVRDRDRLRHAVLAWRKAYGWNQSALGAESGIRRESLVRLESPAAVARGNYGNKAPADYSKLIKLLRA